jgi:hypothetical protein
MTCLLLSVAIFTPLAGAAQKDSDGGARLYDFDDLVFRREEE